MPARWQRKRQIQFFETRGSLSQTSTLVLPAHAHRYLSVHPERCTALPFQWLNTGSISRDWSSKYSRGDSGPYSLEVLVPKCLLNFAWLEDACAATQNAEAGKGRHPLKVRPLRF